jgi:putative transposase
MPRVARLVLPGIPHHVTQRGNRRQRTFFGPDDYRLYQQLLRRWTAESGTAVWAWCLMPNHVHIIVVPEDEAGLRRLFGPVHRQYTWRVNQREEWRGCLWQGRYGSVAMDEVHLQVCLRYVELNPVRAGLVERPEAWPWSSARAHLGLAGDGLTDLEAMRGRVDDWRAFLDSGLAEADRDVIRAAERSGRPLGRPVGRTGRS